MEKGRGDDEAKSEIEECTSKEAIHCRPKLGKTQNDHAQYR